jgi:hypothetical protein
MERQAVTGSAFTALMNAFFISLFALVPHFNPGTAIVPFSVLCLVTSLLQARHLLHRHRGWQSVLRGAFLVFLSLVLYGLELLNGFQLLAAPANAGIALGLIWCLIGAFAIGLVRAWELLGAQRYGLLGWLSPLQDLNDTPSLSSPPTSDGADQLPSADEAVPRSPSKPAL